ncbi:hypothetical protein ACVW0J_001903 [Bradyrhizobium sp. i1.7.7]
MSPPGTFSISSALATPPNVMVRDHDHLAMAWRHRERDVHGIGLPHAGVKPDAQPPLRLRIGGVLRPVSEELAQRTLAGRDDQEIETGDQRTDVALFDAAIFDLAAAADKILHQGRKIDPVVDGAARLREITAKAQRLRKIEDVIVVVIMVLRIAPVIDAEIVLARDRHVVMRDGVEQADVLVFLGRSIRDDRRVHAVLLQVKREMQAGDAGADNSDMACQFRLLPCECLF